MVNKQDARAAIPDASLQALLGFGAATVFEAQGRRGAVSPAIKPVDPSMRLVGRALTVRARPGDNLMLHVAIERAQRGDVIVVDASGYTEAGVWGDVMTLCAQQRGIAGLVVDGAVRDSAQMTEMGFAVFSRGICIKDTTKSQRGEIDVELDFCGVRIRPGDVLVGDRDGLVVVEQGDVERAIRVSREREEKEAGLRAQIRSGKSTLEVLGLEEIARTLGLKT